MKRPSSAAPLTLSESSVLLHVMSRIAKQEKAKRNRLIRRKRFRRQLAACLAPLLALFRFREPEAPRLSFDEPECVRVHIFHNKP